MKEKIKVAKKRLRKMLTRENIIKVVTIVSGLALIATSVLPYIV